MHLLVDVDSKIPNLALMKISDYLKSVGEEVTLVRLEGFPRLSSIQGTWSSVWISCVFTWNKELAQRVARECHSQNINIGGSGYNLSIKLPDFLEERNPDYSLYGDDRAIGFVLRGCIRKCDFCLVSRKEGKITENELRPVETWVPDGFSKVCLLDNEFAAYDPEVYPPIAKDIEKMTLETLRENGWKYSITQGYDLRCVNERKAAQLADYKPFDIKFSNRTLTVAWDYLGIEPYVRRGLQFLLDAGFKGKEIMCYCLSGHLDSHEDDLHRFEVLWKEFGVRPFIMRYRPLDGSLPKPDRWLRAFVRYINRGPASYRNHSFDEYLKVHPLERMRTC